MKIKKCQVCHKEFKIQNQRDEKAKFCSWKCRKVKNLSINYLLQFIEIDDKTKCWNWKSTKDKNKYGTKKYKGKYYKTHRLFYEICNGKIPKDMCVCHRCDNPSCCNPDHLFLGTQLENIQDMINKNRQRSAIGEINKSSKLTEIEVIEIRNLYAQGISSRQLGKKFNINKSTILHIIHRRSWKHI